jgi:hypothetical protein
MEAMVASPVPAAMPGFFWKVDNAAEPAEAMSWLALRPAGKPEAQVSKQSIDRSGA